MKNNVFKYYQELPSWAKGVVVVGGLTVSYIFVSQLIGRFRQQRDSKEQLEEITGANSDLKKLAQQGIYPTLSKPALDAMSSAIIDAVNGCGTDNQKIISQFQKLNNDADILALVAVFGLRKKQRCIFSDDAREDFFSQFTPPMSLTAHLQSDMNDAEIKKINNILIDRGIKYQF
jgi:hypothetical protein